MRETIVTSNVSERIGAHKKSGRTMILIIFVSFVIIVIGTATNTTPLALIGVIAAIGSGIAFVRSAKRLTIYGYGHEGEEILKQQLHSLLSDDYIAYFGYPLKSGGDVDCVLLGPSGLYVIETKHHNGSIQYTDGGWRQVKTGRGGTAYHGNLKNPGGQVFFALHELKSFLESKGIKLFIQGMVTFTNPSAELYIKKNPKPLIVCKIDDLADVLRNENKKAIPQYKREQIEKELNVVGGSNLKLSV